jgi:hypothetical protein
MSQPQEQLELILKPVDALKVQDIPVFNWILDAVN